MGKEARRKRKERLKRQVSRSGFWKFTEKGCRAGVPLLAASGSFMRDYSLPAFPYLPSRWPSVYGGQALSRRTRWPAQPWFRWFGLRRSESQRSVVPLVANLAAHPQMGLRPAMLVCCCDVGFFFGRILRQELSNSASGSVTAGPMFRRCLRRHPGALPVKS